jgi:hypothetical protein
LVQIEMRHPVGDAHPQHAAILRIGVGCSQLERRAVELIGNIGEHRTGVQAIAGRHRGAGTQQTPAGQSRARGRRIDHGVPHPFMTFRTAIGVL